MTRENLILAAVLAIVLGVVGYRYYISTPEYLANQHYQSGQQAFDQGNIELGIQQMNAAMQFNETQTSSKARNALSGLLDENFLKTLPVEDLVVVFKGLLPHHKMNGRYLDRLNAWESSLETDNPYESGLLKLIAGKLPKNDESRQTLQHSAYNALGPHLEKIKVDIWAAQEYALLDEIFNHCQTCPVILQQHMDSLADSEAARALGQFYARSGEVEKAFTLLQPYVDSKLGLYREAEQAYNESLDELWNSTITYLDEGRAVDSFYSNYDAANEEEKSRLVNDFYWQRVDKSATVKNKLAAYQNAASVVPVVLDLGIVRLGRAMSTSETTLRQTELSAAESMFLSVKSYAGDTDDYQLYLGQVYYWLGKADEGDELFSALINKYERSPQVLYSLSNILRDLGARAKATTYIEEAYENEKDPELKKQYAYQRNLLATELDERIEWLEKSDQSKPNVQADLFSSKADKAQRDNDKKSANRWYQQAIDAYLKMPETSTLYNNVALIYMSKFENGRDENDYEQALLNMDKAVALSPDDSIVLSNAADSYATRTYRNILDKEFDFDVLDYSPSLNLFYFLYKDESEKLEYIKKIMASPSYAKMLEYRKKSLLLAPKDPRTFSISYSLYSFLRMDDEVIALANRLQAIGIEKDDANTDLASYRSGDSDAESIQALEDGLTRYKTRYKSLKKKDHPLEYLVVDDGLISMELRLWRLDQQIDLNILSKRANNNYISHPSSSTRSQLRNVLYAQVIQESIQSNTEFKQFFNTYRRIYDYDYLIAMAAASIPGYKSQSAEWSSVKKLIDVLVEQESSFPTRPNPRTWYFLQSYEHGYAKKLKSQYANYKVGPYQFMINDLTVTNREEAALENYFERRILDDNEGANAIIQEAIANGLLLPDSLII